MKSILSPLESSLLFLTPNATASPLVQSALAAEAAAVLSTPYARSLFRLCRSQDAFKVGCSLSSSPQTPEQELELLAVGVAALHAFAQINWTGPSLDWESASLFGAEQEVDSRQLNDTSIDQLSYCGEPVYHLAKQATLLLVALQIFGLIPSPSSAEEDPTPSLERPHGYDWQHTPSIHAWRLRAGIVWLKVLDEPVPLPSYIPANASSLRLSLPSVSADRASISLSLSLLATLLSRSTPHSNAVREASNLAREAAKEVGLEWELTGRLGRKTKWQIDEKTQLVVLARDGSKQPEKSQDEATMAPTIRNDAEAATAPSADGPQVPTVLQLNDDTLLERTAFVPSDETVPSSAAASASSTPLSALDPSDQPHITSFSQSVLLSLALSTLPQPTTLMHLSADVLSTEQVASFVSRVLIDPQNWSVHSMALLLRCRAEAGRSRTVERGVLQMQALVDQLKDGSPTEISAISSAVKDSDMAAAKLRLEQFHALALPPWWELERELATRYASLGITKSSLEIFTRLEMWEEVAKCWASLERPDKGIEVIRSLLEGGRAESELVTDRAKGAGAMRFRGGEKREAKLWCTLGELENQPAHYAKAWEVSGHTSSRAQRSLGAVAWAQKDYPAARTALRLALRINPLFPRTWFVLGCCEMRLQDWAGAQEAFGRCVALEDDDAESWSNLASCHLRRGEVEGDEDKEFEDGVDEEEIVEGGVDSTGVVGAPEQKGSSKMADTTDEQEAVVKLPFSRKRAAFHCLKMAIKHSYESWRMWYNYMIVAIDVGEMSEACRALGRIIEMRVAKDGEGAIDLEVLERLVDAVTKPLETEEDDEAGGQPYTDPNCGKGLLKPLDRLITTTILPSVSNSPRVFLAHARLFLWQQDYAGALDAHLKAYRAGVAADPTVEHDLVKFKEAVVKVEDVVGMLENFGPKEKADGTEVAKNWKFQARSLVRTFLGRTKEAFEDEEGYERLKELLGELR